MIEVIYKEEKQEAKGNEALFHIPRNIRQIGLVNEGYRIYIEDYVYTFLGRLAGSEQARENGRGCLAVLLGDTNWSEGTTYLFIRGALMVEDMEAAADHIDFTDEVWRTIHEETDKYFPEQEIVGWFFSQPQLPVEVTELFGRVHLKHFGGEKVLMLMDPVEREDAFFRYENNYMVRQSGYYIYYEKNPQMQTYMIEKNQEIKPELTEEVEDEAVKTFRKIIKAKKKEAPEEPEETAETEERPSVFSYAATACLAIAVLVVGVNFYNNYQDMKSVRQQTEAVSAVVAEKDVSGVTPLPSQAAGGTGEADKESISLNASAQDAAGSGQIVGMENGGGSGSGETDSTGVSKGESASNNGSASNDASAPNDGGASNNGSSSNSSSTMDGSSNSAGENASGTSSGTSSANAQSASQQMTDEQLQNSKVYQEESDERKARRRAALAAQENQTAAQQSGSAKSDGTQQGASSSDSQDQTASGSDVHESYVIRPGDTLFQISMARYGNMETIEEICRLNGISEDEIIYPGQVIVLP
ncbi:LysM peptidoglycan-binding domain-containing protein [Blautia schinkii]|nr:LysM peptidoglycan-binding domain-containing protein [Blautia schinkii]